MNVHRGSLTTTFPDFPDKAAPIHPMFANRVQPFTGLRVTSILISILLQKINVKKLAGCEMFS